MLHHSFPTLRSPVLVLQFGLDLRLFISILTPRNFGAQLLDLLLDGHLNLLAHAKDYVRDRGGAGRVKDREAAAQRRWGRRFGRSWSGAKRSGNGGKIGGNVVIAAAKIGRESCGDRVGQYV